MAGHLSLNRRQCIAGAASLLLARPNIAASAASARTVGLEQPWTAVQAVLDGFVAEHSAAGVCFAVMAGDSPPVHLSAGTLAFDTSVAMDENSICRIYSMTKNVTRVATLLLVEDGALALDQPVDSVLPEFRNLRVAINFEEGLASRPATRTMTMRHLITDSSGLGNWTPASDAGEELHRLYRERGITPGNFGQGLTRPGYGPQAASLDELVARVSELPLAYEPGTVLHYSIGFDVMALVIERVTGMSYGSFLRQRLFGPLGMTSTGFHVVPADVPRLTSNYDATEGFANTAPDAPPDQTVPANLRLIDDRAASAWLAPPVLLSGGGGLVSTARDFLRYARMLLDEGAFDDVRVMRPETARLATGDIRPAGLAEPSTSVGAGTRALLRTPLIPPGTVGGGGAAGTLFWIDKARRDAFVFMTQAMYGNPARSPFQRPLFAAIEQDIVTGRARTDCADVIAPRTGGECAPT